LTNNKLSCGTHLFSGFGHDSKNFTYIGRDFAAVIDRQRRNLAVSFRFDIKFRRPDEHGRQHAALCQRGLTDEQSAVCKARQHLVATVSIGDFGTRNKSVFKSSSAAGRTEF
jgi:hypothetical protein